MIGHADPTRPIHAQAILRQETDGPIWMQATAFLWFISTFAFFPGDSLLRYPLILAFFAIFYFERDRIAPVLFRCWFLFLIPALSGLSFIWSPYPSEAIREAIFFFLSAFSVVIIGSLMSERQILRAFFLCGLAGSALAFTELDAIRSTNISEYLGQKNYIAMKILISMIAAFAVAANKHEHAILRGVAAILVPMDLYLILATKSATSMVLAFLALALLLFSQLLWVSARDVRGLRTLIVGFAIASALALVLFGLTLLNGATVNEVFELLGRDTTFTGRTALWEQAARTSAEHPILGVGQAGFWQYDVGAAQTLAINDSKAAGTVLGFHNSYLETQVHLGYVGLGMLILMVCITLWKATLHMLVEATLERSCFFVAALIIFSMTFTESLIFAYFHPGIYIFNLAVITAIVSGLRERKVTIRLVPEPAAT